MSDIIKDTKMTQPECNKAVKKLRLMNYLEKEKNTHDERTVSVSLNKEKSKEIKQTLSQIETLIQRDINL